MKKSPLRQISVFTTAQAEDAVLEMVSRHFDTQPSVFFNEKTGETIVSIYCPESDWKPAKRAAIKRGLKFIEECGLDIGPGSVRIIKVPHENWAESWKKHFTPLEIGPKLLIKPSWSRKQPKKGQKLMVIDPGLSFGTGRHATTSFCLHELVATRQEDKEQSLLDIGCGSGILSIGAAMVGYQPVHAFDFDPEAVRVGSANATSNRMGRKIEFKQQDLTETPIKSARKYHVVCANLMYDLLLAEKQRIINRVRKDGRLVLAGILTEQYAKVKTAFQNAGMAEISTKIEGEWQSGSFVFA